MSNTWNFFEKIRREILYLLNFIVFVVGIPFFFSFLRSVSGEIW